MATTAPAPADAPRTSAVGWVFRSLVGVHVLAIVFQPVFVGVYLSGDVDSLDWHATGADVVTALGYVQLVVAIVLWARLRVAWPFVSTLLVVAAETVQYLAGMAGALWLHVPLGVLTVAGLVVQFVVVWSSPLAGRPGAEGAGRA